MSRQTIWDYLQPIINNDYGLAGLMGNMAIESGYISYIRQGDVPVSQISIDYTNAVNNGTKTRYQFAHDDYGYGLSQWTYFSRKENLYDWWQASGVASIGDETMQLDFLVHELQTSFPGVFSYLQNATSIEDATIYYMRNYENPSVEHRAERISAAIEAYNECSGNPPHPPYTGNFPIWLAYPQMKRRRITFV